MLARAPAYCFSRKFLCLCRFSRSLKAIKKAMSKFRTIVCCSKYNQNDIRYQSKAPLRVALASINLSLSLSLIFFYLLR